MEREGGGRTVVVGAGREEGKEGKGRRMEGKESAMKREREREGGRERETETERERESVCVSMRTVEHMQKQKPRGHGGTGRRGAAREREGGKQT